MGQEQLGQIQNNIDIAGKIDIWLQIFLLVVLGFYTIFAFIVFKQMKILNETIHTPQAGLLRNIALAHLIFAGVLVVVTALLIIF